jgi:hypothetical protein
MIGLGHVFKAALVDLLTIYAHRARRCDAEADAISLDGKDRHPDIATDDDLFADVT